MVFAAAVQPAAGEAANDEEAGSAADALHGLAVRGRRRCRRQLCVLQPRPPAGGLPLYGRGSRRRCGHHIYSCRSRCEDYGAGSAVPDVQRGHA